MATAKAAEYFGLFLTQLRNNGYPVTLADDATAYLLREALAAYIAPPGQDGTADALFSALDVMLDAGEFITNNGA